MNPYCSSVCVCVMVCVGMYLQLCVMLLRALVTRIPPLLPVVNEKLMPVNSDNDQKMGIAPHLDTAKYIATNKYILPSPPLL